MAAKKDLRNEPAYPLTEAARYIKLPPATLRAWTFGRPYPTAQGSGHFRPIIRPASPRDLDRYDRRPHRRGRDRRCPCSRLRPQPRGDRTRRAVRAGGLSVVFFTDRDPGLQFPRTRRDAGLSVERRRDHFAHDCEEMTCGRLRWRHAAGSRPRTDDDRKHWGPAEGNNLENNAHPAHNVKPVMMYGGQDASAKKTVGAMLEQALPLEHMTLLWVRIREKQRGNHGPHAWMRQATHRTVPRARSKPATGCCHYHRRLTRTPTALSGWRLRKTGQEPCPCAVRGGAPLGLSSSVRSAR